MEGHIKIYIFFKFFLGMLFETRCPRRKVMSTIKAFLQPSSTVLMYFPEIGPCMTDVVVIRFLTDQVASQGFLL